MVTYTPIVQNLPPDLQVTLLQLVEAVEQNLREQLTPPREEIIDVRAMANGLIEMQQSMQQQMDHLDSVLQQLAEAQLRTEARMKQLAEAQQRTEARMEQLAEAQQHTEQAVNQLTSAVTELTTVVRTMQPRLAKADGWQLEQRYVERASSYFGRWLRQIDVLWPGRLDRTFEKKLDDKLTPDEKDEVLRLDAILRGKAALATGAEEIYVALEASVTVNQHDVERAAKRAAYLRALGMRVVAVVAGEVIEPTAETAAQANGVAILRNGSRQGWEQALAAA